LAKTSALTTSSILTGPQVIRDYSLHFDTTTASATWNMQSGGLPVIDPDMQSLNLNTNIKLTNANPADGTYFLGELLYKGTKTVREKDFVNVPLAGVQNYCITTSQQDLQIQVSRVSNSNCQAANSIHIFADGELGYFQNKT